MGRRRRRRIATASVRALAAIKEEERGWLTSGAGATEEGLAAAEAATVEGRKGRGGRGGFGCGEEGLGCGRRGWEEKEEKGSDEDYGSGVR
ncbi:hypothetical protein GW17_00019108 [Ensete ventricosum]|nr:hypothetical protein GW17_00019108 [Ensete ventricosum]